MVLPEICGWKKWLWQCLLLTVEKRVWVYIRVPNLGYWSVVWHSIDKRNLVQSLEPFLGLMFCSLGLLGKISLGFAQLLAPLLVASSKGCEVRREHPPFWLCILYIFMHFVVKANWTVCRPRPCFWVAERCVTSMVTVSLGLQFCR